MRRITVFCLALPLILLGLTHLVGAQNVSIELTPITYPIVLPDSGGSFDYLLTVTNQGGTPITATVWCMATLPNGGSWGPSVGPGTQTLAPGQTLGYYRSQSVPPRAPFGYFIFYAYVGIYPDTVWAQDQFEFQRQGVSGTEQLWAAIYNGPFNDDDVANGLVVDGAGNVFVTGQSYGVGTRDDYVTIKYDTNGNQIWVARYNGPANWYDIAYSLAVDGGGNVYVTGESAGVGGTAYDYATIKYDASGNQLWVARYNGPGNNDDVAYSLALDGDGNVYVTGGSSGAGGTSHDYATVKYDGSGNQLWVARYNGPWDDADDARSLAVDDGGNVYVTGYSYAGETFYDYATIKYDASGNQIWVARYNESGNGYDRAYSLAVDDGGNVYVTGTSDRNGTYYDYATIKYDASGSQLWVACYNGPGDDTDEAWSLAVDGGGNVYVTGSSASAGGTSYDYATVKYDGSGNQLWVARYNGPGDFADLARSLAVDGDGNVYVTGWSYDWETRYDCATVKYDAAGNQLWVACYNGPGNYSDKAYSLGVDGGGNVYVTGRSESGVYPYHDDYATIKYSGGNLDNWMPVEATVFGQPLPQECRLEQNFPNPFNATTVLSFQLPVASHVKLEIFDVTGRVVGARHASPLPLVDGWRSAGVHELTWDASDLPSGIYFARMQAGGYAGVQKLILLK